MQDWRPHSELVEEKAISRPCLEPRWPRPAQSRVLSRLPQLLEQPNPEGPGSMPILTNTPLHSNSSWLSSSTPDPDPGPSDFVPHHHRCMCAESCSHKPCSVAGPSACSAEPSRMWIVSQSVVKTNTALSQVFLFFPLWVLFSAASGV